MCVANSSQQLIGVIADYQSHALRRVAEVLVGCIVGLIVSWLMSYLWPLPESRAA